MRYIREVKEGREEGGKEGNLVFNCVCCGSTLLLLVLGPQGALRLGEHPYINLSKPIYLPALVAANTHHLIALILDCVLNSEPVSVLGLRRSDSRLIASVGDWKFSKSAQWRDRPI